MFEFIILIVISAVILKVIRSILKPFQDKIKNEADNARKLSFLDMAILRQNINFHFILTYTI